MTSFFPPTPHYLSSFVNTLGVRDSSSEDVLHDNLMLTRLGYGFSSKRVMLTRDLPDSTEALKKLKVFLVEKGFLFATLCDTRIGILRHADASYIEGYVELGKMAHSVNLNVSGDEALVNEVRDWFNLTFVASGSLVTTASGVKPQTGRLVSNTVHLSLEEGNRAEQEFYPYMKLSLEEYYAKFMESKENVLVLYGPPGTGKSTFLRSLIATKTTRAWLTYNKSVIESDLLVSGFYDSKAQLLALEDIDKYMGARTDGNSLMSSFLNSSEGIILRKDKKIVFSTNLATIDKIDSALLRRGRCFDVIKFELLTIDQARAVEVKMNLPAQDLSSKVFWSLSEILNPVTADLQMSDRAAKSIGFN